MDWGVLDQDRAHRTGKLKARSDRPRLEQQLPTRGPNTRQDQPHTSADTHSLAQRSDGMRHLRGCRQNPIGQVPPLLPCGY